MKLVQGRRGRRKWKRRGYDYQKAGTGEGEQKEVRGRSGGKLGRKRWGKKKMQDGKWE